MPEHDPGTPHTTHTTHPVPPVPAQPGDQATHPSVAHRKHAADHLRLAAQALDRAVASHAQRAHATAKEHAKEAAGHVSEARAHAREADRLHDQHEQQG